MQDMVDNTECAITDDSLAGTEGDIQDMVDNTECPIVGDSLATEKKHSAYSDEADKIAGADILQVHTSATPMKMRVNKRKAKDPPKVMSG